MNKKISEVNAIKNGLKDIRAGRTKPARNALNLLAKKYGIKEKV